MSITLYEKLVFFCLPSKIHPFGCVCLQKILAYYMKSKRRQAPVSRGPLTICAKAFQAAEAAGKKLCHGENQPDNARRSAERKHPPGGTRPFNGFTPSGPPAGAFGAVLLIRVKAPADKAQNFKRGGAAGINMSAARRGNGVLNMSLSRHADKPKPPPRGTEATRAAAGRGRKIKKRGGKTRRRLWFYETVASRANNPDAEGEYVTYGLTATRGSRTATVRDVSISRGIVEKLADTFNRCRLDPAHMMEALEDILY
jgi:hypothetical protein